jgi:thiol-disulfide isomerase/thioredoxin
MVSQGAGVAVLAGVAAVALGLDTGLLAQWPSAGGNAVEKQLLERLKPMPLASASPVAAQRPTMVPVQARTTPRLLLPDEGAVPPLTGAVEWLNSPPLTAEQLRGKVVLVDFWTFGCINCRNALPYVREWHRKYKDQASSWSACMHPSSPTRKTSTM